MYVAHLPLWFAYLLGSSSGTVALSPIQYLPGTGISATYLEGTGAQQGDVRLRLNGACWFDSISTSE